MKKTTITALIASMLLLVILATAASAATLPIRVDRVEVDNEIVTQDSPHRLDVERDQDVDVKVKLTALDNAKDVEVQAFITGFEFNNDPNARLGDVLRPFDAEKDVSYIRNLRLTLPDIVEKGDYQLRVVIASRNSEPVIQNYPLKIDVPRRSVKVEDVLLQPEGTIKAGYALLSVIRVSNKGQKTERNIKVSVAIPQLSLRANDFIDEIKNTDDQEETEELYLNIPVCTKAGVYTVETMLQYNDGKQEVKGPSASIEVLENERCEKNKGPATTIVVGSTMETISSSKNAAFPITIANNAGNTKNYLINVQAPLGIDVTISPSTSIVLEKGKSQTVYIFANANDKATSGPQTITATVLSGATTLENVPLTVNIIKTSSVKKILTVGLVILIALIVVIGLIIGFSKLREKGEGKETQVYY